MEFWLSIFRTNPPISVNLRSSLRLDDSIRWREELYNFYQPALMKWDIFAGKPSVNSLAARGQQKAYDAVVIDQLFII